MMSIGVKRAWPATAAVALLVGVAARVPEAAVAQTHDLSSDAESVQAVGAHVADAHVANAHVANAHVAEQRIPLARLEASLPGDARLQLYAIEDRPGLYVMHASSLAEQGAMFSRVVALLERRDMPRDHIVTMAAIAAHARHFNTDPAGLTAGNNFSAAELAHFFDVARRQHMTLTDGERRLQSILVQWGVIREDSGAWVATHARDFLITIPGIGAVPGGGTIDATVRAAILSHELGHWQYFSDAGYARACRSFWWHDLSYGERAELTRQLANIGYDQRDRIVIDETQAYLLHTPVAYVPIADTPGPDGIDVASVRRRLAARVGQVEK